MIDGVRGSVDKGLGRRQIGVYGIRVDPGVWTGILRGVSGDTDPVDGSQQLAHRLAELRTDCVLHSQVPAVRRGAQALRLQHGRHRLADRVMHRGVGQLRVVFADVFRAM